MGTVYDNKEYKPLKGGNKSPNEFIEKMEKVYSTDTPWHFRARNFQSYELGFDSQLAIDADLKTMSRIWNVLSAQFNLIMITEFYWESLILIKDSVSTYSKFFIFKIIQNKNSQNTLKGSPMHELD